jgi:hypothetical protein
MSSGIVEVTEEDKARHKDAEKTLKEVGSSFLDS